MRFTVSIGVTAQVTGKGRPPPAHAKRGPRPFLFLPPFPLPAPISASCRHCAPFSPRPTAYCQPPTAHAVRHDREPSTTARCPSPLRHPHRAEPRPESRESPRPALPRAVRLPLPVHVSGRPSILCGYVYGYGLPHAYPPHRAWSARPPPVGAPTPPERGHTRADTHEQTHRGGRAPRQAPAGADAHAGPGAPRQNGGTHVRTAAPPWRAGGAARGPAPQNRTARPRATRTRCTRASADP